MSKAYLIAVIPLNYLALQIRLRKNRPIYILDTSLIDFVDRRPEIDKLIDRLKASGYGDNIQVVDPLEHEKERWFANLSGTQKAQQRFSAMTKVRDECFFLGNYLAHRYMISDSRISYISRIVGRFLAEGVDLDIVGINCKNPRFIEKIGSKVTWLLGIPLLLTLFARYSLQSIKFRTTKTESATGGICVDLSYCNICHVDGTIDDGGGSDAVLVQKDGYFSIKNHIFLAMGWPHPCNKVNIVKDQIESHGGRVIGDGAGRVEIYWKDFVSCVRENLSSWLKITCGRKIPGGGWTLYSQWLHFKYQLDRFRAQILFNDVVPSVYFSKLDYNHVHHPVGAVCQEKGISFCGICHSPSAGGAHVPQGSIISFEHFFVYSDFFPENLYPTWKSPFTTLHSVGTWRTDFIHKVKRSVDYLDKIHNIKNKFDNKFIIGLHLPVPNSYLFRQEDVERWMACFENILASNPQVVFVLFPRRLNNSPRYFLDRLERLIGTGRAEIASTLVPEWKFSYPWAAVCDLVIGCTFSDTVMEAWACSTPALSYSDIGKGQVVIEKYDKNLRAYGCGELENVLRLASQHKWPPTGLGSKLRKEVTGVADGHCVDRIRSKILEIMAN